MPELPAQPSLQRFLALEKQFSTFDEQLREACRVIDLNVDGIQARFQSKSNKDPSEGLTNPRANWVLRRLLDKLTSPLAIGKEARSNPLSWNVLTALVSRLPIQDSATQLKNADFLKICALALKESFDWVEDGTFQFPSQLSSIQKTPSKKRKRAGTPTEGSSGPGTPDSLENLFRAICQAISTVLSYAESIFIGEGIGSVHMRKVVVTEPETAASILGYSLKALQVLHAPQDIEIASTNTLSATQPQQALNPMAQIWALNRSFGTQDEALATFSNHCMLPLAALLARIDHISAADEHLSGPPTSLKAQLETLVVSQLIAPARDRALRNGEEACSAFLARSLSTIKRKILLLEASPGVNTTGSQVDNLHASLVLLWVLALRVSIRKTMRQRNAESVWLHDVFTALAECAGFPLNDIAEPRRPNADIKSLVQLIQSATRSQFNLRSELLRTIVTEYSGLVQNKSSLHSIKWPLLISTLKANPTVFLLRKLQANSDTATSTHPADTILRKASQIGYGEGSDDTGITRHSFLEEIIVPIMQAHASARDLTQFLERWHAELVDFRSTRAQPIGSSIWENKALRKSLRPLLEIHVPITQLKKLFRSHLDTIAEASTNPKKFLSLDTPSTKANECYASIVIIDAMLESLQEESNVDELHETLWSLAGVSRVLAADKRSKESLPLPSLWRIMRRVFELYQHKYAGLNDTEKDDFDPKSLRFSKAVRSAAKAGTALGNDIAIECFACLLSILRGADQQGSLETCLIEHLGAVIDSCITEYDLTDIKAFAESINSENLSLEQRIIALMLQYPESLTQTTNALGQQHRTRLIGAAIADVCRESTFTVAGTSKVSSVDNFVLGQSLFETIATSPEPAVKGDLMKSVVTSLESANDENSIQLMLKCLLSIPWKPFAREHREKVLNHLTECIDSTFTKDTLEKALAVMVAIMDVPNMTATVSTEPRKLLKLAQTLKLHISDRELQNTFRHFIQLVLDHVLTEKDQPRSRKYLQDVQELLLADEFVVLISRGDVYGPLVLYTTFIMKLVTRELLEDAEKIIKVLCSRIEATLPRVQKSKGTVREYFVVEECVRAISSILESTSVKLDENFKSLIRSLQPKHLPISLIIQLSRFKLHCGEDAKAVLAEQQRLVSFTDLEVHDYFEMADFMRVALQGMNIVTKAKLGSMLATGDSSLMVIAHGDIQSLQLIVSTLGREDTNEETTMSFVRTLYALTSYVGTSDDQNTIRLIGSCLSLVLKEKQWLAQQVVIESILENTAIASHKFRSGLTMKSIGQTYLDLCSLTNALILLHRKKLGSRFHLVNTVLQNLLVALYSNTTFSGIGTSTHWAKKEHAAAFARVLATLCSPTISSVARHGRAQNNLVDETKAAKEYAGKFCRYLISTYCNTAIEFAITAEIKEALMPGIWSVMDVVGEDGLRSLSSGLNNNTRAVLRGLVSDWRRFGKSKNR